MNFPRFRIAWLMAFVAIVALNLAGIRALSGVPVQTAEPIELGAFPMGNILAICCLVGLRRPSPRPFLRGFVASGAVATAMLVYWATFSPESLNHYPLMFFTSVRTFINPRSSPWMLPPLILLAVSMFTLPQLGIAMAGGWLFSRYRIVAIRREPIAPYQPEDNVADLEG
jgi:hypothetical protein